MYTTLDALTRAAIERYFTPPALVRAPQRSGPLRWAVYVRISKDSEKLGKGVARQEKETRAKVAARRDGSIVTEVYSDNDMKASRLPGKKAKVRPSFNRMIQGVVDGDIDGIAVFDVDRLARDNRELEDIIDLEYKYGLQFESVGGAIDLSTVQGRGMARMKGVFAKQETEQQSLRMKSKVQELAEEGRAVGPRAYGYARRDDGTEVLVEHEANIIKEIAQRLLTGQSVKGVADWLNEEEVPTRFGAAKWDRSTVRDLVRRPRNIGQRLHRGNLFQAQWPPILDVATYQKVMALLDRPHPGAKRDTTSRYRHLLTGIATCARCGHGLAHMPGQRYTVVDGVRQAESGQRGAEKYTCRTKGCGTSRASVATDDVVIGYLLDKLQDRNLLHELAAQGDESQSALWAKELADLQDQLDTVTRSYLKHLVTISTLELVTAEVRPRMKWLQDKLDRTVPAAVPNIAGPRAAQLWEGLTLEQRRALVAYVCTVQVHPLPPRANTRVFDPTLIVVKKRQAYDPGE